MSKLRLQLFGAPQVFLDGAPVQIGRNKALALLVYLAANRTIHRRDALATLFWPETGQASARTYLRQSIYHLSRTLGEQWFVSTRDQAGLALDVKIQSDLDEFTALIAASAEPVGDEATVGEAREVSPPLDHLRQAVELAQAEFLAGFTLADAYGFDDWLYARRQDIETTLSSALGRLIDVCVRENDFALAIDYARRLLALDELNEAVHRMLMQLYAAADQPNAALRQFATCRRILRQELAVDPSQETIALYSELLNSRTIAGASQVPLLPAAMHPPPFQADRSPQGSATLPGELTRFIGREAELAELGRLLDDDTSRLITVLGPGGMGKTRLAVAIARHQQRARAFQDGIFFVPLAPLTGVEQFGSALAHALGVTLQAGPHGGQTIEEQLHAFLQDKHLLLVLDNFEHLLGGVNLIDAILQGAPGVHILVTSRERLRMRAEQVLLVHGLGYSGKGAPYQERSVTDAERLFEQSARQIAPDFSLNAENLPCVREICQLVEGMPLGIELAAAWITVLSSAEIAEEIRQNLDFLQADLRATPARHQSIRAIFDSTWQRLNEEEQAVFAALSVFRGGFSRTAGRQISGATLHQLDTLAGKSLIEYNRLLRHYTVHELLRQYAAEKLHEAPIEMARISDRHGSYYLTFLADRLGSINSATQGVAAEEIAREFENIRVAWRWAIGRHQVELLAEASATLFLFCQLRSRFLEGAELQREASNFLSMLPPSPARDLAWAQTLNHEGWLRIRVGDFERAQKTLEKSRALYHERRCAPRSSMGSDPATALSIVYQIRGDYGQAVTFGEEARLAAEQHDDPINLAYAHYVLTSARAALGDYPAAARHAEQACALARAVGNRWFLAIPLNEWGKVARAMGHYDQARAHFAASYGIKQEFADPEGMAVALGHLGEIAVLQEDFSTAEQLFDDALAIYRNINDRGGLAAALRGLGQVACARADYAAGQRFYAQALTTAAHVHFWPLIFFLFVDVADLFLHRGEWCKGLELLSRVHRDPLSGHEAKAIAAARLAEWQAELDPGLCAEARLRSQDEDLEALLVEVLASLGSTEAA